MSIIMCNVLLMIMYVLICIISMCNVCILKEIILLILIMSNINIINSK